MSSPIAGRGQATRSHRPRPFTVFAAAFVAGAAAAVGVNRAIDVHLAQTRPQVEREAIFVALHSLPQGSPVTVWDVALREWPKAMLPATAMRACDTFDGLVLRHPLREGQPILAGQLVRPQAAAITPPEGAVAAESASEGSVAVGIVPAGIAPPTADAPSAEARQSRTDATPASTAAPVPPQPDLWLPGEQAVAPVAPEPPLAETAPRPATKTDVDVAVDSVPEVVRSSAVGIEAPLAALAQAQSVAATTAPVAPTPPGPPVMQYLVMPERIATQAERSLVTPPAAGRQPVTRPPVGRPAPDVPRQATARTVQPALSQPAPSQPSLSRTSVSGRQSGNAQAIRQPNAGRQPTNVQPTQKPTANRQPANAKPTSAGPMPAPTRQPRPVTAPAQPAGQSAAPPKTMFPNITAGLAAVEREFRRIGIGRPAAPATSSTDDAAETPASVAAARQPAAERTAARPRTTADASAVRRQ